jgi:hypothetical protein
VDRGRAVGSLLPPYPAHLLLRAVSLHGLLLHFPEHGRPHRFCLPEGGDSVTAATRGQTLLSVNAWQLAEVIEDSSKQLLVKFTSTQ